MTIPTSPAPAIAPAVILAEPQLGENIGMVARAMANFGLVDLRIVNPRDGWPSETARAAASRADHVIDGARLYGSVRDAVADLSLVFATTARPRDSIKEVVGPTEGAERIHGASAGGLASGILFGRERYGLSNDEISLCDAIVTFPVNPDFASLNIAQAVLLMSYEWRRTAGLGGGRSGFEIVEEAVPARKEDLHRLFEHLEGDLDRVGYFFPPQKREVMVLNLRDMLTKANFSGSEVHSLFGVLRALQRREKPGA